MKKKQRYTIPLIVLCLFSAKLLSNTAIASEFIVSSGYWGMDSSWDTDVPNGDNVHIGGGNTAKCATVFYGNTNAGSVAIDRYGSLNIDNDCDLICGELILVGNPVGGWLFADTDCNVSVEGIIFVGSGPLNYGSAEILGSVNAYGLQVGPGGEGNFIARGGMDIDGLISVGYGAGTGTLTTYERIEFSIMNIGAAAGTGLVDQNGTAEGTTVQMGQEGSPSSNIYNMDGGLTVDYLIIGDGAGTNTFNDNGTLTINKTMTINSGGEVKIHEDTWSPSANIVINGGILKKFGNNITFNSPEAGQGDITITNGSLHTKDLTISGAAIGSGNISISGSPSTIIDTREFGSLSNDGNFNLGGHGTAKMTHTGGVVRVRQNLYISNKLEEFGPDLEPTYTLDCASDSYPDLNITNNMYAGYPNNSICWFQHNSGDVMVGQTMQVGYYGTGLYCFDTGSITADTISVGSSGDKGTFLWSDTTNGVINANMIIDADGVLALGENHSLPYNYNNLDVGSGNAITMNALAGIGVGNDATATYSGSYDLDKDFYALDGGTLVVTGDLTIDDGLTLELDDGKVECEAFILGETGLNPDDGTLNITANGGEVACSEGVTLNPSAIITADADYTVRICLDDNEDGYFDNLVENPATGDPALDFEHLELICEYDASNVAGTDHSTLTLECAGDPTDPWDVFGSATEDNNFIINHLTIGRNIPSPVSGSITLELVNNNDNNNGGDGRVVDGPANEAVYVRMLEILPGANIDCGGTYTDANDDAYAVYPLYYARIPGETTDNFRLLIPGDFNLDGTVNLDDHIILSQNYGAGTSWATGDANGDRVTDLDDFIIMKQHYGESTPEE